MYKRDLTDILEEWVNNMTFPVNIYTVSNVGNIYTLGVDNLYHVIAGMIVTINGNPYTVVSFDDTTSPNLTLVVTGVIAITTGSFNLYSPIFTHGTIRETQVEATETTSPFKVPTIWLYEQFEETEEEDPDNSIERESNIRLFFLTTSDHTLTTDEIYTLYIQPMQRLKDNFVKYINDFTNLTLVYKWEQTDKVKNYAKFGAYINGKGMPTGLFSDKLSGCEMDIKLILYKPDCGCL